MAPLVAVLDAARAVPNTSVLFISSGGAVYGEPDDDRPVHEDHPLRPRSAYGAAKLAAETYLGYFARRYGLHASALRCGNAYGPDQEPGRGQGLIGELIAASDEGRAVEVWGDGSVSRDYVHVDDIAAAIASLCGRRDLPEAINVGSGESTSVVEAIALVSELAGRPLSVTAAPARPFDVHRIALDISRLRDLIDFDPVSLREGIRLTRAAMVADTVA
jgi:UDP-glucose 4-epimerase